MWHVLRRPICRAGKARRDRRNPRRAGGTTCRTFEWLEPRRLLAGADCAVVFNEIMYHPAAGNEELEWVELYNHNAVGIDMSNWVLDGVNMTFSQGTVIQAGQYLVVAANPSLLSATTGLNGILGPYSGRLSNGGEKVRLYNNSGRLMDEVNYSDSGKWPLAADGSGASMAKRIPDSDSQDPASWVSSIQVGGTPGARNFPDPNAPPVVTQPISAGATWKFESSGSDLGPSWTNPNYSDSAWSSGASPFYAGSGGGQTTSGTVSSTITADNFFAVYVGSADGSNLRFIGRDTKTDWTTPESFSFLVSGSDYIFLLAWEDWTPSYGDGGPQMLIGEFTRPDGTKLGTNTTDWKCAAGPTNGCPGGLSVAAPAVSSVQSVITTANSGLSWQTPAVQSMRISSPWGSAISAAFTDAAKYIWSDTFDSVSISNTQNTYILFRSAQPVLPTLGQTQLPVGPTTYYYRTAFNQTADLSRTTLALDTLLDDGAVVYLNGSEVYRQNMPTGTVNFTTHASAEVTSPAYVYRTALSTGHLVLGTNVVAVEVHTAAADDADMLFSANLLVTVAPVVATTGPLVFNEVAAGSPSAFWLELTNASSAALPVGGYMIASSSGGQYVLPAQTISPGGYLTLSEAQFGFGAAKGDKLFVYSSDRQKVLDAVEVDDALRGRLPDGSGPWLFPTAATPGAANVVPLRSDIVINEIMYEHRSLWTSPSLPPQDSPEQWIELYNRGTVTVDLSGWKFDSALHFTFPAGTMLAAGSYLVISNNATVLRAKYPTATILGDFTDSLSHTAADVVLKDSNQNPVDSVTYYDGGEWPEFAAGGGSSLELRSPNADNSVAETWAASDEGSRTSWNTYPYTTYTQASIVGPDGTWQDFDLGLLSDGTVLIDDISVIDMASPATQLIQNGGFESGTSHWRLLGNQSHSSVIVDPANSLNHVLKLVATGPEEHMSNHVEGTLANGVAITNGHTYKISFRAKWLTGSNQVNTRLYFDRDPHTTPVDQSDLSGTPGQANSVYVINAGPTYRDLKPSEVVPGAHAPVTISVTAADPDGIASLVLWYSVNGGAWSGAAMTTIGTGRYQGTIPGQDATAVVQFYVNGADNRGAHTFYPAAGPKSRAMYKVDDGLAVTNGLHNLRIIMTPADAAWLDDPKNVMSNDPVGCTVVYDESVVFYDAAVRTKASERGRENDARVGFYVYFEPDHLFRGVCDSVGIDRSEGVGFGQQEMLIKEAMDHAGFVMAEYSDLIQVITPDPSNTGAAELQPTHFSQRFLDSQFDNGGDGQEYKFEYIYYPTTTADGTSEGFKVAQPDNVVSTSLSALGASGNLLKNSDFESWSSNVPSNWTVSAGAANISASGAAYAGSYALKVAGGLAGTLTAISQSLSVTSGTSMALSPLTPYSLIFRVRNDGTIPAVGTLTFSFVDGSDTVVTDGQGGNNVYSLALTSISSGYTDYMATFRTPAVLPTVLKLKIGLSTALTRGRAIYVDGVALSDMAADKENARYSLIAKNNRIQDDYSQLIKFTKFWSTTGRAFTDHVSEYIDVDEWLRAFAFGVLSGATDNYAEGDQHNARFYVRPSDGRVLYIPQDMDFITSSTLSPIASTDLQKLLAVTSYARTYYGDLYDIITTAWNTTYMAAWTAAYGNLLPSQDFAGHLNFIGQRSQYVLNNFVLPYTPQVAFSVTSAPASVNAATATLQGNGWINVHEIRLAGLSQPLQVTWLDKSVWQAVVPLSPGVNNLHIQAYDFQGKLLSDVPITITSTLADRPLQDNLRVTELNYHPYAPTPAELTAGYTDANSFEFIELINTSTTKTLDLHGVQLTAGVTFNFSNGSITSISPGSRIVVVKSLAAFQMRYGTSTQIAGQYSGTLSNSGEEVTLVDSYGTAILDFSYGTTGSWPSRADGNGSSLEIVSAAGDYSSADNWQSSAEYGGSPGTAGVGPMADVVINEVLTHTDIPEVDSIELHNPTAVSIDIGGWYLSDSNSDYLKFRISDGTQIAAHGYLVFYEGHWVDDTMQFANNEFGGGAKGFGLDGQYGDDVYLTVATANGMPLRFADHVSFGPMANGESAGRWPDGSGDLTPLRHRTLGGPNVVAGNGPRVGPLLISEIMYDPDISRTDDNGLEYIEIYNPQGKAVDLTHWLLSKGVSYAFAAGTQIDGHQPLVVVAFDPNQAAAAASFRNYYGMDSSMRLVGPYAGSLSDTGETVELSRPNDPPPEDPSYYPPLLEDEIQYQIAWGGAGNGQSLTRTDFTGWGEVSATWLASAPSPGTVALTSHTMTWKGAADGNWTDASQWTGLLTSYPDYRAGVVINSASTVTIDAPQEANMIAVSSSGGLTIASTGALAASTDITVSTGGILAVEDGATLTSAGLLTVNSGKLLLSNAHDGTILLGALRLQGGGSVLGGVVNATSYELVDGMASANLLGAGGVSKSGAGTVTLSGSNSYAGGTDVASGTLIVSSPNGLPDGSELSVGANAILAFASLSMAAATPSPMVEAQFANPIISDLVATHAADLSQFRADTALQGPSLVADDILAMPLERNLGGVLMPAVVPRGGIAQHQVLVKAIALQPIDMPSAACADLHDRWTLPDDLRRDQKVRRADRQVAAIDAIMLKYCRGMRTN
jgi:autotransporter-associated beta strand protein